MEVASIIEQQRDLCDKIEKLGVNFKKESQARRTKENVEKRQKKLEEYWKIFKENHATLQASLAIDDPYFTEKIFEETKRLHNSISEMLSIENLRLLTQAQEDDDDEEEEEKAKQNVGKNTLTKQIPEQPQQRQWQMPIFFPTQQIVQNPTIQSNALNNANNHQRDTSKQGTSPKQPLDTSQEGTSHSNIASQRYQTNYQRNHGSNNQEHTQWHPPNPQNPPQDFTGFPHFQGYPYFPTPYPYQGMDYRGTAPKLPPISIEKFTGDLKKWQNWIQLFESVIDKNQRISNVEKLQYLNNYLEGEPKELISDLKLQEDSYQEALDILKQRYDDQRQIILAYTALVLDQKKVNFRSAQEIIDLHNKTLQCYKGLKTMGAQTLEILLTAHMLHNMDNESLRIFEQSLINPMSMPSINEVLTFLKNRHRILQKCNNENKPKKQQQNGAQPKDNKKNFHISTNSACEICNAPHKIFMCKKFKDLTPQQRKDQVKQHKLCYNCLSSHHRYEDCSSTKTCKQCNGKHNTLLHFNKAKKEQGESQPSTSAHHSDVQENEPEQGDNNNHQKDVISLYVKPKQKILPTALIKIRAHNGRWDIFRALVDTGSAETFISEEAVQNLALPRQKINAPIQGIGQASAGISKYSVELQIKPRFPSNIALHERALVLPKLTGMMPSRSISATATKHINNNMILADPTFNIPGPIDLILGINLYSRIIKAEIHKYDKDDIIAQETNIGWIILGEAPASTPSRNNIISLISMQEIDDNLRRFWDMETNKEEDITPNEDCEKQFKQHVHRDESGRFTVSLPFRKSPTMLGNSKDRAMSRFFSVERRMEKDEILNEEYHKFMKEYIELGHMSEANDNKGQYYLPHHAVFKPSSTTTKTRVVFDASCKTSTGVSLNDVLHTGSKLQSDLTHIVMRWRKHEFVIMGDIEKMFRQILVREEDRNFQRILWREDKNMPVKEYTLNTVTYGTGPATYLSVRCLQELANQEELNFPKASKTLREDFYVDDLMTGAKTINEARQLQKDLINLLAKGGFNLRKWVSNTEELTAHLQPDQRAIPENIQIGTDEHIKALGIEWNQRTDEFTFSLNPRDYHGITKRQLLSSIASIFDPIGWLAPITVRAKILMQELWNQELNWDDPTPSDTQKEWSSLMIELRQLDSVRIPRWIHTNNTTQLHGFCDASQKAYAAVVYTRSVDEQGRAHIHLIAAKTKVAPLKNKVTLPRLELNAAVLLANLLHNTLEALQINKPEVYAWSDSEITLAWIAKPPTTWETYIANRVSKVQISYRKQIGIT
ncbi:uncharacterized protein LOC129809188 [Phlebotomus papatasi]|uniref:uncharacterized protein LOC129809188 n=1 Tax=Phlebotomus papatasi TaxID=29031 RepID=UPI0024833109|nr:uncharacterized protein LOC129809188 [Phlebotomus papatasi]